MTTPTPTYPCPSDYWNPQTNIPCGQAYICTSVGYNNFYTYTSTITATPCLTDACGGKYGDNIMPTANLCPLKISGRDRNTIVSVNNGITWDVMSTTVGLNTIETWICKVGECSTENKYPVKTYSCVSTVMPPALASTVGLDTCVVSTPIHTYTASQQTATATTNSNTPAFTFVYGKIVVGVCVSCGLLIIALIAYCWRKHCLKKSS
jgi:hypothetical protein